MSSHSGPLQVLIQSGSRSPESVELLPNPAGTAPWRFAREHERGFPAFGSRDIIKLAVFGEAQGFTVVRFQIVDSRLDLVAEPEQSEVSDDLVETFRRDGEYGLNIALANTYEHLYLNGVGFQAGPGVRLEIRSRGVTFSNDLSVARTFVASAWSDLDVS